MQVYPSTLQTSNSVLLSPLHTSTFIPTTVTDQHPADQIQEMSHLKSSHQTIEIENTSDNRMRCIKLDKSIYKCQECDYTSYNSNKVTVHMRSHSGEKPFSCQLCNYRSTHNSNLRRHMTVHSSKMSYKCLKCSYSTKWQSSLKRHIIITHNVH